MARRNGDNSWQKLFGIIYGLKNTNINQLYGENHTKIRLDEIAVQNIISFVRSGNYAINSGELTSLGTYGFFWGNYAFPNYTVIYFLLRYSNVSTSSSGKNDGFSLRCVAKYTFFS